MQERAMTLRGILALKQLEGRTKKSEGLHLAMFITAQRDKDMSTFCAIVLDRGTWQRHMATYFLK